MTRKLLFCLCFFLAIASFGQSPISLHPDNPRYFLYKGKPTVLISSAEHYGALLNLDFDYNTYLDVLQAHGFNQTRAFTGMYCEGTEFDVEKGKPFSWDEVQNSLSPRPEKFITPWARSTTPGYVRGGNKFDLDKWDDAYFKRLKDFLHMASARNVVVELVLFTAIYSPSLWASSPLNPLNNINGTENAPFNEYYMPKYKNLFARQKEMTRKIVQEVNEFDNVYFEICNEPYWLKGIPGNDSPVKDQQFLPELDDWQKEIAKVITDTEKDLPKKHLIAQNIANFNHKLAELNPSVSILNFHYAFPPDCIEDNYRFNRPIVYDETHDGVNAANKRIEAWTFMLSGGAGYSNLDWSFVNDDASGLGRNPLGKRRSGKEVREQLKILVDEMNSFDFVKSKRIPASMIMNVPEGLLISGLYIPDKEYLLYFLKQKEITYNASKLELPRGTYSVRISDPLDGRDIKTETLNHGGGQVQLSIPEFMDDLLLRISTK